MKKKVLFMMPALPGGGAEKVLMDVLKHFDYQTYTVTLFLEYREGVYLADIPRQVEVLALHGKNNLWFQRIHRRLAERKLYIPFHECVYRRMLLRLLRNRSFDTIVSFMEGAAVKFHSYIFDKAQRNVSWVHIDLKKKHWSLGNFRDEDDECAAYRRMDEIVFVSQDARSRMLEMYPLDASRCSVLYNLIDAEAIQEKANSILVEKRRFTVCMVGRLNRQKRYDRAVEVAHRLKEAGYEVDFWVLGEGELEADLRRQIARYGLEDSFILKGFVKPPYAYLAQADMLLNTSESEGYPLTICEALCLGVPVVATRITGASEILDDSRYGLLVDEAVDSIYQGIKSLLDDRQKLGMYAQKAKERSEIFQVSETMKSVYELLD